MADNPLPIRSLLLFSAPLTPQNYGSPSNSHSSALTTCKHGESNPNELPKKHKTHHSKGGSDEVDERREGESVKVERGVGKAAR